jgi:hypothetical protein
MAFYRWRLAHMKPMLAHWRAAQTQCAGINLTPRGYTPDQLLAGTQTKITEGCH